MGHFNETTRSHSTQGRHTCGSDEVWSNCAITTSIKCERIEKNFRVTTYHRRFIWMYAGIMLTLYSLFKKEKKNEWMEACQHICDEVKRILTTPKFVCPNWTMEFHIHFNALNVAISTVLAQNIHGK